MSNSSIGMGAQDSAERAKFENEVKRITAAAKEAGLMLRLLGSLAFQVHCPQFGFLQAALGRAYTDIDFHFDSFYSTFFLKRKRSEKISFLEDNDILIQKKLKNFQSHKARHVEKPGVPMLTLTLTGTVQNRCEMQR